MFFDTESTKFSLKAIIHLRISLNEWIHTAVEYWRSLPLKLSLIQNAMCQQTCPKINCTVWHFSWGHCVYVPINLLSIIGLKLLTKKLFVVNDWMVNNANETRNDKKMVEWERKTVWIWKHRLNAKLSVDFADCQFRDC